jgi:NADPH:quinone reductase-like Zn-dependent oxidoreductase
MIRHLTTQMRAAVYERYGSPEVVELRDVPMPMPKPNQLLIQIHASTVSSGDWRARSLKLPAGFGLMGRLVFGIRKPRQPILGSEFSGRITAIGSSVTRFEVGEEVFGFAGAAMGAHAEYLAVAEDGLLAHKPANLSHEEAAALSFGGMTVLRYFRQARITAGDRVAINGASGAIGVAAIQLAKHFGAHVTAISSGVNLALSKSLGADEVVDYTKEDFTKNGQRYEVILDAAGTAPFSRVVNSLTAKGRFIPVLGSLSDLARAPLVNAATQRKIVGGVVRSEAKDPLLLSALASSGVYRAVIDRQYDFDQIVEAHRYVDTGRKRGSVVVRIRHGH